MRVQAYYSINPDVHHIYDDCVSGTQIPAINRRLGDGDHRLCQHCEER